MTETPEGRALVNGSRAGIRLIIPPPLRTKARRCNTRRCGSGLSTRLGNFSRLMRSATVACCPLRRRLACDENFCARKPRPPCSKTPAFPHGFLNAYPARIRHHFTRVGSGAEPVIPSAGIPPTSIDCATQRLSQFGFESNTTPPPNALGFLVYGPAPEFGIRPCSGASCSRKNASPTSMTISRASSPTSASRVVSCASEHRACGAAAQRLIQDETGNLEIILKPLDTLEDLETVSWINHCWCRFVQATVSAPHGAFWHLAWPQREATLKTADFSI